MGKTFLVREAFQYDFAFYHTGVANESKTTQLSEFKKVIDKIRSGETGRAKKLVRRLRITDFAEPYFAFYPSPFTFSLEIPVFIVGPRGEGWSLTLHPPFTTLHLRLGWLIRAYAQ